MVQTILLNGALTPALAARLPWPNRGLAYGDGFFETLIFEAGRLRFAELHLARMQAAAAALHLALPAALASVAGLEAALARLAAANGLPAARLRLQLWRAGGGRYGPLTDAAEWLATAEPFAADDAPVGRAGFARDTWSVLSPLSFCKGPQAWLYVRAAHERARRGLDEIILLDAAGHVAEAGAAAVFWLSGNELFTPSLATGCVAGVRRAALLAGARAAGVPVREGLFGPAELLAADLVFTANVAAVRVVGQVGEQTWAPGLLPPLARLLSGQ